MKNNISSLPVKEYDTRVKFMIKKLTTYSEMGVAKNSIKAIKLLINEMSAEKGFVRHDGRDYFVHPISVAQTAIDFGMVEFFTGSNLTAEEIERNNKSDAILTTCLLHDIIEDVEWVNEDYIRSVYGDYLFKTIDNVTKRDKEHIKDYLTRVASDEVSALVKILDRLDNVRTLSNSTFEHRERQLEETREYYLPLTKSLRYVYFENSRFLWQARIMISSILDEVERGNEYERRVKVGNEFENQFKENNYER